MVLIDLKKRWSYLLVHIIFLYLICTCDVCYKELNSDYLMLNQLDHVYKGSVAYTTDVIANVFLMMWTTSILVCDEEISNVFLIDALTQEIILS